MRGKPPRPDSLRGAHRITPAHAGKTRRMCWPTRISADHPRACGENTASASPAGAAPGSPPRMRGKHPHQSNLSGNLRITPAHAGKTTAGLSRSLPISDHPRACGENGDDSITAWRLNGSPPRMRGKLNSEREKSRLKRITPAHAGKTPAKYLTAAQTADHPRACGENLLKIKIYHLLHGSPPRMRGKQKAPDRASSRGRITPAHAGKTFVNGKRYYSTTDHPRACGENTLPFGSTFVSFGSPPRMRGKRYFDTCATLDERITPAHAGKTPSTSFTSAKSSDHPRACGENGKPHRLYRGADGSPPRMRGKPVQAQSPQLPLRITPAHAGKTA